MGFALPPVDRPAHVAPENVVDFDIYAPPPAPDVHLAWKLLQAPGVPDIVWTPRNGGHWIMARGAAVSEAYADYGNFSNRIKLVPKERGEQFRFIPSTLDPPAHRPFRLLLNGSLTQAAIQDLEPQIAALAESLIDDFRDRGSCDFTREYAEVLPIQIFLRMCKLPLEDGPKLKYLADQFTRPDGSMSIAEASQAFADYLDEPVRARRKHPGTDVLSRIVAGEVDGKQISHEQALAIIPQVLLAGLDTVVNFLSFALLFLARNPAHRRQLIDDPALTPAAVEELLRRFPLVLSTRVVARDITFQGVALREGDMVVLPTPLFGLDERRYESPMDVDFHRQDGEHLSFGRGHHHCPGRYLARSELRITIDSWLRKIPDFAVADDTTIVYRGGVVSAIERLPLVWDV